MSDRKSIREIIDRYSPIVRGRKGLLGLALKAIARPVELAHNVAGAISRFPFSFGYENAAGQSITDCSATIPATFARMERKLRKSFNAAATREAKEDFLRLAGEVRRDSETLSTHCTILRQEFDTVTEKYSFILVKEPLGNREYKMTTLEDGVAAVTQQLGEAQAAAAEEAAKAVENAVTVRRKPLEIPKPKDGPAQGLRL